MQSSWAWQQPRPGTASKTPSLSHATSMLNLHDFRDRSWQSRSPSPSESSSSTARGYQSSMTVDQGDHESRSSTPTPGSPVSGIFDPSFTYLNLGTKNPWRAPQRARPSPPLSPMSSPNETPIPATRSSSPIRPSYQHSPAESVSRSPPRHIPSQRIRAERSKGMTRTKETINNNIKNKDVLPVQAITPQLHLELKHVPGILTRSGWQGHDARWAYQWAVKQPKTALLLWMSGELQAWTQAQFWDLKDSQIPFAATDLQQIVLDPEEVIRIQWRVAMRQLPRDGQHVEFNLQDHIPLSENGVLADLQSSTTSMVKVHYLDDPDNQPYVRRRMAINAERPQDKNYLLARLAEYNRLEHDGLAKITSSYARGQVVAYITPLAHCNLAAYLAEIQQPVTADDVELLVTWAQNLCSALAYLHRKDIVHRSIRPEKILLDPSLGSIFFATFGVNLPTRSSATTSSLHQSYSEHARYIYAAPEVVARQPATAAADLFSLGCCLLDILGVACGLEVKKAANWRSARSHDLSFQANLDRVVEWIQVLQKTQANMPPGHEQSTAIKKLLSVIKNMLSPDPAKRKSMREINKYLNDASRGLDRRVNAPPQQTVYSMRRVRGRSLDNTSSASSRTSSEVPQRYRSDAHTQDGDEVTQVSQKLWMPMPRSARRGAVTISTTSYPEQSALWDLQNLQSFYKVEESHHVITDRSDVMASVDSQQTSIFDFGYR